MDQVFHFQGSSRSKATSIQQQSFSDTDTEDTQSSLSIITAPIKKSTFSSVFKNGSASNGYATDSASSDGESTNQKSTSHFFSSIQIEANNDFKDVFFAENKASSNFNHFSTKQPNGDEGLIEVDETDIFSPPKIRKEKKLSVKFEPKKLNVLSEGLKPQKIEGSSNHNNVFFDFKADSVSAASPLPAVRECKMKGNQISQKPYDSDADAKKVSQINETIDNLKQHPYRHLIFSNLIQEDLFKKHLSLIYRGLVYASKCLKGPSEKFLQSKQIHVKRPKNSKGKTLLLDLDETLIHSCALRDHPDHIITAYTEKGEESKIGIKIRPYCMEFLQKLSQVWDVFIFTASSPIYAQAIVDFIDPSKQYISGVLNRNNCMETKNGFYIKDLRIIKDSDLRSTILVDNLSHSFGFQPENGVPIIEWHNDKSDTELKHLIDYLTQAASSNDVREFNRKHLKLNELIQLKSEDLGI